MLPARRTDPFVSWVEGKLIFVINFIRLGSDFCKKSIFNQQLEETYLIGTDDREHFDCSSAISRALSIVGARIGKETKFDDNMSILLHAVSATT